MRYRHPYRYRVTHYSYTGMTVPLTDAPVDYRTGRSILLRRAARARHQLGTVKYDGKFRIECHEAATACLVPDWAGETVMTYVEDQETA